MAKIKCPSPDHDDQNPSAEIYSDGIYCFSCGYYEKGEYEVEERSKENIAEKIKEIKSFPTRQIRGLTLPYSSSGFYIIWPESATGLFYKLRTWSGTPRYIAPKGHRPPLFILGEGKDLVIIEGELNLLSLSSADINSNRFTLCSPGPATQIMEYIDFYLQYSRIFAIVDHDPAGVAAGIELKRELLKHRKRVQLITCKKDINQILQDEGKTGVQKWWREETGLEVFKRLQER